MIERPGPIGGELGAGTTGTYFNGTRWTTRTIASFTDPAFYMELRTPWLTATRTGPLGCGLAIMSEASGQPACYIDVHEMWTYGSRW